MKKLGCVLWMLLLPLAALAGEAPEELLKRADALERESKAARAADLYQEFLKSHPTHTQAPEARYRLAKCQDSLGLIDEAISHLETVIKTSDKRFRHRPDAFYMLGKLHASLKSYERAAQVFEQMLAEQQAGLYEDEVLSLCGGYYAVSQ